MKEARFLQGLVWVFHETSGAFMACITNVDAACQFLYQPVNIFKSWVQYLSKPEGCRICLGMILRSAICEQWALQPRGKLYTYVWSHCRRFICMPPFQASNASLFCSDSPVCLLWKMRKIQKNLRNSQLCKKRLCAFRFNSKRFPSKKIVVHMPIKHCRKFNTRNLLSCFCSLANNHTRSIPACAQFDHNVSDNKFSNRLAAAKFTDAHLRTSTWT